jgi:hypothetical protein
MTPKQYHSDMKLDRSNVLSDTSWLSKSTIWELFKLIKKNNGQGALHEWRYNAKPLVPTDSMNWGTLVDMLTMSTEEVESSVAISEFNDFRTNAAKEWKQMMIASGRIVVTQKTFDKAVEASEFLLKHNEHSAEIFANSDFQKIVTGRLKGCNIKGMIDMCPRDSYYLADLKTTYDMSPYALNKTIADYGYNVQGGLYLALYNAMHPDEHRTAFKLVFQSSQDPSHIEVVTLNQEDLDHGKKIAVQLIASISQAAEADDWGMPMEYVEREAKLNDFIIQEQTQLMYEFEKNK